jgi:glutamine amidotransferase-like uncharacterized protein
MKKIALYSGVGSQMVKDLEFFLSEHDIPFQKINHTEIQRGNLEEFDTLIIGGGSVFDIVPALQHSGVFEIQQFVKKGGKYIGICAGAYIATKEYYDNKGFGYRCLRLVDIIFKQGIGEEVVDLKLKNGKKIKLFFRNGPVLSKILDDTKVLAENPNREIAVFEKNLGKGKVYLFSGHPEGNLENGILAKDLETEEFFINIINN